MKQYFYDKESINKNYLASYSDSIIRGTRLFLINTLTDRQMIIDGRHNQLEHLVTSLENGISDNELLSLLSELGEQSLLKELWIEGLIE